MKYEDLVTYDFIGKPVTIQTFSYEWINADIIGITKNFLITRWCDKIYFINWDHIIFIKLSGPEDSTNQSYSQSDSPLG